MTNPFTQPAGAKPAHMKLPAPWHDTLDYYQKSWTARVGQIPHGGLQQPLKDVSEELQETTTCTFLSSRG